MSTPATLAPPPPTVHPDVLEVTARPPSRFVVGVALHPATSPSGSTPPSRSGRARRTGRASRTGGALSAIARLLRLLVVAVAAPAVAVAIPIVLLVVLAGPARADVPVIDFTALPATPVDLPGGWTAGGCSGDAPLLCTWEDGRPQGTVEHLDLALDSFTEVSRDLAAGVDPRTALRRDVDRHHTAIRADRRAACGDRVDYVPDPTVGATVAGTQGVRWGASLVALPEGRVVERTIGFSTIRGDRIDVLVAHEIDEGACTDTEGMQVFTDGGLDRFAPTMTQVVARTHLGAGSRPGLSLPDDVHLDAADPVDAAIALSVLAHPDDSVATAAAPGGTVLVARDDVVADTLASGAVQGALDAPLLLTGSGRLDDRVAAEVSRLGAARAIVLGGPAAISPQVVEDLTALGLQVQRVGGADRVATALSLADAFAPDLEEVVVVRSDATIGDASSGDATSGGDTGDGDPSRAFADALAAGALAADHAAPVLLTPSATLDGRVAAWLERRQVQRAVLVGGEAALRPAVAQALAEVGVAVDRLAGAERAATAVLVADRRDLPTTAHAGAIVLADGRTWHDGLAASLLAHHLAAPVLLTDGDALPAATAALLATPDPGTSPRLVCTSSVTPSACAAAAALRD